LNEIECVQKPESVKSIVISGMHVVWSIYNEDQKLLFPLYRERYKNS
jgi:hypothetical protein